MLIAVDRWGPVADNCDPDDVSARYVIDALGREQETIIINEAGLYSLILRSKKP